MEKYQINLWKSTNTIMRFLSLNFILTTQHIVQASSTCTVLTSHYLTHHRYVPPPFAMQITKTLVAMLVSTSLASCAALQPRSMTADEVVKNIKAITKQSLDLQPIVTAIPTGGTLLGKRQNNPFSVSLAEYCCDHQNLLISCIRAWSTACKQSSTLQTQIPVPWEACSLSRRLRLRKFAQHSMTLVHLFFLKDRCWCPQVRRRPSRAAKAYHWQVWHTWKHLPGPCRCHSAFTRECRRRTCLWYYWRRANLPSRGGEGQI